MRRRKGSDAPAGPEPGEKAPTMIIPRGTEIQVDVHGQLSIRTPGNLVIQNSGHYATLESKQGSIRIEPDADVEAVNVRCAETCFVEGSLTAWRVTAQSIHLEDSARANIVLQEADRLEVGSDARLVGNFGSENELFLLFSRFADEVRSIPLFGDRGRREPESLEQGPERLLADSTPVASEAPEEAIETAETVDAEATAEIPVAAPGGKAPDPEAPARPAVRTGELPDPLFFSLVILEREFGRPSYGPSSQRVIEELIKLLRERDLDTLRMTYRTLFGRIVEPGKDVQRVLGLIGDFFAENGS